MKKNNLKKINLKKITITNLRNMEMDNLKGGLTLRCISGEHTGCDSWCGSVDPCMV